MRFGLRDMGGTEVAAGAQAGRRVFAALLAGAPRESAPGPMFLDLAGIEAATSSFLREAVFAFRDYCRHALDNTYPVVANATEVVAEEIAFYAKSQSDAIWSCELSEGEGIAAVRLIGRENLDLGQQEALKWVEQLPDATAPLMAQASEQTIGVTAWNNRLASLAAKGIIMEQRRGKTKIFRPVLGAS
jgi:hypothetical protein